MDNEENREEPKPKQLKLKINGGEKPDPKAEPKEKESGSKIWVIVILIISVVVSLIFSVRNRQGFMSGSRVVEKKEASQRVKETREEASGNQGGGLFGPAVYEFGR